MLNIQSKMGECESALNHMRRIMQSLADEKTSLEAKLDNLNKEKERQIGQLQNLKSQCLDLQLSASKLQAEREEMSKVLSESEAEKNDIVGKFDQYGSHLQE